MAIPAVIHQTFPTAALPPELQANVEALLALNPGWRHVLYDDAAVERFIQAEYPPEVFTAWRRINPRYGAARADLFRYLLVYRLGGVYLDSKSTATRPFAQVIEPGDQYLLAYWPNGPGESFPGWGRSVPGWDRGELQQWHLVAAPGHPFLRAAIDLVLERIRTYEPVTHGVGHGGVLYTTGPVAYTQAILPLLGLHPHRLVPTHQALGLRYSIYRDEAAPPTDQASLRHASLFSSWYGALQEPLIL